MNLVLTEIHVSPNEEVISKLAKLAVVGRR